jgi:hypothetical protein
MANKRIIDKDLGLKDILKEMEKLKSMCVKVGLPEGSGEHEDDTGQKVSIAHYAALNELGVINKDGSGWRIPPRPFIKNTADGKREKIQEAIDKNLGLVLQGKADAKTALGRLGEAAVKLTKDTIKEGPWTPNSEVTIHGTKPGKDGKKFIKGKGSTKPLIDTGTMKNSIQYVIEENGIEIDRGK